MLCARALKSTPLAGNNRKEGEENDKWTSKQTVEAHEVRSLWCIMQHGQSLGKYNVFGSFYTKKLQHVLYMTKKRSHALLNEDGNPGKNNNLKLNTDVEYRAERMRK
jgi:hypothetical protein